MAPHQPSVSGCLWSQIQGIFLRALLIQPVIYHIQRPTLPVRLFDSIFYHDHEFASITHHAALWHLRMPYQKETLSLCCARFEQFTRRRPRFFGDFCARQHPGNFFLALRRIKQRNNIGLNTLLTVFCDNPVMRRHRRHLR